MSMRGSLILEAGETNRAGSKQDGVHHVQDRVRLSVQMNSILEKMRDLATDGKGTVKKAPMRTGELSVSIIAAQNLELPRGFPQKSMPRPFVAVTLGDDKRQSEAQEETRYPFFGRHDVFFSFPVRKWEDKRTLRIELFSSELTLAPAGRKKGALRQTDRAPRKRVSAATSKDKDEREDVSLGYCEIDIHELKAGVWYEMRELLKGAANSAAQLSFNLHFADCDARVDEMSDTSSDEGAPVQRQDAMRQSDAVVILIGHVRQQPHLDLDDIVPICRNLEHIHDLAGAVSESLDRLFVLAFRVKNMAKRIRTAGMPAHLNPEVSMMGTEVSAYLALVKRVEPSLAELKSAQNQIVPKLSLVTRSHQILQDFIEVSKEFLRRFTTIQEGVYKACGEFILESKENDVPGRQSRHGSKAGGDFGRTSSTGSAIGARTSLSARPSISAPRGTMVANVRRESLDRAAARDQKPEATRHNVSIDSTRKSTKASRPESARQSTNDSRPKGTLEDRSDDFRELRHLQVALPKAGLGRGVQKQHEVVFVIEDWYDEEKEPETPDWLGPGCFPYRPLGGNYKTAEWAPWKPPKSAAPRPPRPGRSLRVHSQDKLEKSRPRSAVVKTAMQRADTANGTGEKNAGQWRVPRQRRAPPPALYVPLPDPNTVPPRRGLNGWLCASDGSATSPDSKRPRPVLPAPSFKLRCASPQSEAAEGPATFGVEPPEGVWTSVLSKPQKPQLQNESDEQGPATFGVEPPEGVWTSVLSKPQKPQLQNESDEQASLPQASLPGAARKSIAMPAWMVYMMNTEDGDDGDESASNSAPSGSSDGVGSTPEELPESIERQVEGSWQRISEESLAEGAQEHEAASQSYPVRPVRSAAQVTSFIPSWTLEG